MRYVSLLVRIIISAVVLAALPAAADASAFEQIRGSLALIGYPVDDKRLTIAFGTGFCVSSSASRSYFVTNNHVVTDGDGNLAPGIFAVFPKTPGQRYKATVVRRSADPDLAIVAVDAPCDATVKLSAGVPDAGDEIAIAGFPYTEVCELAAMCSASLVVPNAHAGRLVPVLSRGTVNEAQEGSYSILYDALADHGNSGGPLFDFANGAVYGVVVDVLPGYSDEGTPPQERYNRAIAVSVGLSFINKAPVAVAMAPSADGQRGAGVAADRYAAPGLGSTACRAAWRDFDRSYGEWAQLHGKLRSLAGFVAEPAHAARTGEIVPLIKQLAVEEGASEAQLRAGLSGFADATAVRKRAVALADAVHETTVVDSTLAGGPGNGSGAADPTVARLRSAAQEMDAAGSCL